MLLNRLLLIIIIINVIKSILDRKLVCGVGKRNHGLPFKAFQINNITSWPQHQEC